MTDPRLEPTAAPDPTLRLFLALWPQAATRRGLAAWQDAFAWPPGAAVVAPGRLHLTLHFIGAVPASRLPELAPGLGVPVAPFALWLDRAELWPRGLAVLGTTQVPDGLAHLHATLGEALRRLGLPLEARPLRPHVTLARRARGAVPGAARPPLHWPVSGYALVQSAQGYRRLADYGVDGVPRVSR